ncbi:hypothetical protein [Frankia sp. KB5]|uniref:hypothetical protein n=1 Tax=Frankia sp. KB5 TaxID=683318 RepID=UPI000A0FE53A|nr:hypothetical protein [Frankia sp. KB5]ORT46551.1 hypothetical protein KBI5_24640 [Frankia sp. KB5]
MEKLSPELRSLRARAAANSSWARTWDRAARTQPARAAMLRRFEQQVDPDGVLDPAERARRAEYARKAHMQLLALRSAQVRRERRRGSSA